MKTIVKGLTLIAIVTVISFLMPGFMDGTEYSILADEAEWSDSGEESDDAAFTIVEIVPYKGMGEIGYLIGGQEPVDQELMSIDNAAGDLSFLGSAITVYRSYAEKALPSPGILDSGWFRARTYSKQDGYFEIANAWEGAKYTINTGKTYVKVEDGTGRYKVTLRAGTTLDNFRYVSNPINHKNVNAYFVYGKPTGVALFDQNIAYEPYSVTQNTSNIGNYDYDSATGRFLLNKGNGRYDVIFISNSSNQNQYYMTADYEIVEDNTGLYSTDDSNIRYDIENAIGNNYNRINNSTYFTYTNAWDSRYRWVQAPVPANMANYQNDNGKIWLRGLKVLSEYQYTYNVELVNNEWFKRMSLGITSSQVNDYTVNVVTITPDELNLVENQHYIDEADMFYINAKYQHNGNYIMLYENYNNEGKSLPTDQKYGNNDDKKKNNLNFAIHDLTWDTAEKIFIRAAGIGCYKAAMVLDSTFYGDAIDGNDAYKSLQKAVTVSPYQSSNATMCNMAKLYIMIYQRNMIDFYNSFMNPDTTNYLITQENTTVNKTATTGSFIRPGSTYSSTADSALYWNDNTFLPYGLDSNGTMVSFIETQYVTQGIVNSNIRATTTDLSDNVLTIGGSPIFTGVFKDPIYNLPADSQDEATIYVNSLDPNAGSTTTISISNLTNLITNNGQGYEEIGGESFPDGSYVEGVDTGIAEDPDIPVDDGSEGSGFRRYKRVLNIQPTVDFTTSEGIIRAILINYDVQIINMTSTEFNGSIEDINTYYDMIYMGNGFGRFNTNNNNKPDFNDNNLDSYYYFSEGDWVYFTDWSQYRYRGNDITAQKKREMERFLAAGYPIVLDSSLYQLSNAVKNGTNIYTFINQTKNNSSIKNFLNLANYNGTPSAKQIFLSRLKNGLEITRPKIKLLQPVLAEGSLENYSYVDPTTETLNIRFSLFPKANVPSVFTYNAYLFIDKNGDSIFEATEQVDLVSDDGSNWVGMKESKTREYSYQYDLSELNGIYQWQVLIKRQDNTNIQSSVTGYTANTKKMNLNILHIRENNSSYDLKEKVNDTASLIWKYAGKNKLTDYNLVFDSLTIQQFEKIYNDAEVAYTTANAASTNKLLTYHLLIMDNPNTPISNLKGAVTNIKDELAKDLGVIYTKNALGIENQDDYFSNGKYSFLNKFTYNHINRNAMGNLWNWIFYKYIYKNLDSNGTLNADAVYKTTYLTKTNEGEITRYPYQINPAIMIAENSYSNKVTIDYDILLNQRLVGWYTLSDSKSPVVRKAGLVTGGTDAELHQGMYSSSPNDVKNNYYLFSYGRCFYSGLQLVTADTAGNDNEMKLFVNTIITAYKASKRVVSSPPIINFIKPVPIIAADLSQSITITSDDIIGEEFVLTFDITNSSSNMDLSIVLDTLNPVGNWNENIYRVTAGVISNTAIAINNTNKAIAIGRYAVKIPITELTGANIFSLNAENLQLSKTTAAVTLIFVKNPEVTIDPAPIINPTPGYRYVDIDFNELDTNEDYLNAAQPFRVVFKVEKSLLNAVYLSVSSDGTALTDGFGEEVSIYPIDALGNLGTKINPTLVTPNGLYAMDVPVSLMKDHNSREIIVTASETPTIFGFDTITLLRRSLFPLD